jgi:hypothetical protein
VAGDSIERITALENEIGRLRLERLAEALKQIEVSQTGNMPAENRQTEK